MSLAAIPEPPDSAPELNIRDYLDVLRRRMYTLISVFVIVFVVGILMAGQDPPIYVTEAKLVVPTSSPYFSFVNTSNPIETMLAAAQPDSLTTQLQVLQSSEFLAEASEKAGIVPRVGVISPSVSVATVQDSNVIQITVTGGSPADVAKLANTIVDLHLEKTSYVARTGLRGTKDFVEKEKAKAERELEAAQRKLLAFRKEHRVVQLTAEQESQAKEYVALQAKVRETASNITSAKAQIAELRNRLAGEPIDLVREGVKDNPRRAELQSKLNGLKFQRLDLLRELRPASREIRDLDREAAQIEQELKDEPETLRVRTHEPNPGRQPLLTRLAEREGDLQGYVADHNAALALFATKKQVVDNLGPWEVQLNRFTNERDAAQAGYNMLSERLRDLDIRSHAENPTARPIERAQVPVAPIRTSRVPHLAFAGLLALFLAIGTAFLQDHLDDRLSSPDDVERVSTLPVLGHVPLMAADQPRLMATLPASSHVAEAYRGLRSSIGFAGIDAPIRTLLLTSPSQGEGKTTTAVNLAIAMAIDGKRVVLVDADLRRPSVHRLFNLANVPGLSDVLAGLKPLDEALQETEIENLRVICAGTVPPNPAELLGSRAFDAILGQLEEQAELVLFDMPPCIPVTDPLTIARRMDGVLLVVNAGETRRGAVRRALELLSRARARTVGVVMNRVRRGKGSYYSPYQYYYGGDYYSDEAQPGDRHRRNGHEPQPELQGAATIAASRGAAEEEEA